MGGIGLGQWFLVLLSLCFANLEAQALTRAPMQGTGEPALIYWRYLCRGQPQETNETKQYRELSCPSQLWKVRTKIGEDRVVEVVEDAS